MNEEEKYNFQYCQKLVIFSKNLKKVLLCKRKGEKDYNSIYSFIGGKMETTDENIITAIKREKDEEVGEHFKIKLYQKFSNNLTFKKSNGKHMILPHYLAKHIEGEIKLNEEYSDYKWIEIEKLENFEPKIDNIPQTVKTLLKLIPTIKEADLKII